MTTPDPLLRLAAVKAVRDYVDAEYKRLTAEFAEVSAPGDRKYVLLGDEEVATISRTRLSTRLNATISDMPALVEWLEEHQPDALVRTVEVEEWFMKQVVERVKQGGEIPPGIDIDERTSGGSVSVRQSDDQRAALFAHIDTVREIMGELTQ